MKTVVTAAVVLLFAGRASAENEQLGNANGPWFVGASARYIRDGRIGFLSSWDHEGPTGWGYGLEAGRKILPWLSTSVVGRLAHLSEDIWTDPGTAHFTERQLELGARVDLWPVAGRLRMGAAYVRSWRRSETALGRTIYSPADTFEDSAAENVFELELGVVPLRWHGFEVELTGSFAREPDESASREGRTLSTFSVGLGLRWLFGCAR